MLITKNKLKTIINSQFSHLIKEENYEYDFVKNEYEVNKQLLICADYYKKITNTILKAHTQKNSIQIIKLNVNKLITSPNYEHIINIVNNIHVENNDINRNINLLKTINDLLTNLINTNFEQNAEEYNITSNGVRTPNPKNINKFMFQLERYNHLLTDIINNTQKQIAILSNQIGVVTHNNDNRTTAVDQNTLHAISKLESISTDYFKNIELLFQQISSIGHDIENGSKTSNDYEVMNPKKQIEKAIADEEAMASNPKYQSSLRQSKVFHAYDAKDINKREKFNKDIFLKALYKKEFPNTNSDEITKAKIINDSVHKIDDIDKQIKKIMPEIHNILWNEEQNQYTAVEDITDIYRNMKTAKTQYKALMFSFLNALDKKDVEMEHFFKTDTYKFEAFIKLIQFFRINNKQIFLDIIHNRPKKDVSYDASKYSEEHQAKVKERLMYWDLFRKLGWLKGQERTQAPNWLYESKK